MTYVEVFRQQYGEVYRDLTEVVNSLPDEALNWVPYGGANSISVLLTHLLGNQVETLRAIRGVPTDRNRSAEFEVKDATQDSLLAQLATAEAVLAELAPQITPEELDAIVVRPAALNDTDHTGLYQLGHSIAHAREHVGQIWMTRDLWGVRSKASTRPALETS
jgi:uncharacterized damage-inducible protein DinB